MKKLAVFLIVPVLGLFLACNSAQHKTGGDRPDTGSKHGSSGASDTINGSAAPFAQSTNGTDTSSDGHGVTDPLVDSGKSKQAPKKHK